MKKLTKEQATIASGFTGVVHDPKGLAIDASKRMGRNVDVMEIPRIRNELKDLYLNDFVNLFDWE